MKKQNKFYDGTKLLSLMDINGDKPEIYMSTSNRSAGKTTYFNRLLVNRFLKHKEKFMLIYRFDYELDDCANKFFKDIGGLFFSNYYFFSEKRSRGKYHELFIDKGERPDDNTKSGIPCGYAISMNSAEFIRKASHFFSDTCIMFFDEFQSETNNYLPNEINMLQSIHTSVARGQGVQSRYVPLIMCSNQVSIINPYYVEFDIANRIQANTNFLRGEGWVLENGFVESASLAQKQSAFNRAFKKSNYLAYASENVYLNDSTAFIEKPVGANRYIATLKYKDTEYGLREYRDLGIIYCDTSVDKTYPHRLSITTADHNINYVMLKTASPFVQNMRYYFEHGAFRFKDLSCKDCIMHMISY